MTNDINIKNMSIKDVSLIIGIFILILFSVFLFIIENNKNRCLKDIAKNYCEEKDLYFYDVYLSQCFTCYETINSTREKPTKINFRKFYFLHNEITKCGKTICISPKINNNLNKYADKY